MKIKKITLIQTDPPLPDYFTQAHVMPRHGFIIIGTILQNKGYDVKIYVENVQPPSWERILDSDVVCFYSVFAGLNRAFEWADKIRGKKKIPLIIGGTASSYYVTPVLEYFDYIVHGEGDETVVELLERLKADRDVDDLAGISIKRNGRIINNFDKKPVSCLDIIPDYTLIQGYQGVVAGRKSLINFIQFSRGCHFNCKFCVVREMFGPGYRTRSIDSTIADIKDKLKYSRSFLFVDNDFFGDREKTRQLLQRIVRERIKASFTAYATIHVAKDTSLLKLAKKAGVRMLVLGLESFDDRILKDFNKKQTSREMIESIKSIKKQGIEILGSFVVGSDNETKASIKDIIRQSNKYAFSHIVLFISTLNNTDRYAEHVPNSRILVRNIAYFNGCYVSVFPMNMKPTTLQKAVIDSYREFFSFRSLLSCFVRGQFKAFSCRCFYRKGTFPVLKHMEKYLSYLAKIEEGMYDENERLIEEKLPVFKDKPLKNI